MATALVACASMMISVMLVLDVREVMAPLSLYCGIFDAAFTSRSFTITNDCLLSVG